MPTELELWRKAVAEEGSAQGVMPALLEFFDDHLADCVDLDEADEEEWNLMACSMGRDGQCGQAGTEFCDFECPIMASLRREDRKAK